MIHRVNSRLKLYRHLCLFYVIKKWTVIYEDSSILAFQGEAMVRDVPSIFSPSLEVLIDLVPEVPIS